MLLKSLSKSVAKVSRCSSAAPALVTTTCPSDWDTPQSSEGEQPSAEGEGEEEGGGAERSPTNKGGAQSDPSMPSSSDVWAREPTSRSNRSTGPRPRDSSHSVTATTTEGEARERRRGGENDRGGAKPKGRRRWRGRIGWTCPAEPASYVSRY